MFNWGRRVVFVPPQWQTKYEIRSRVIPKNMCVSQRYMDDGVAPASPAFCLVLTLRYTDRLGRKRIPHNESHVLRLSPMVLRVLPL